MNTADVAAEKLQRIYHLWEKLRGARVDTPEYETLVHEIGVLSMEYHALTESYRKNGDSH
jgi:hypothetical protein